MQADGWPLCTNRMYHDKRIKQDYMYCCLKTMLLEVQWKEHHIVKDKEIKVPGFLTNLRHTRSGNGKAWQKP